MKRRGREIPALQGAMPRTITKWAGARGTASFSAITPALLVMVSAPTGLAANVARSGGSTTCSMPAAARVQLILMKSWQPVSRPD